MRKTICIQPRQVMIQPITWEINLALYSCLANCCYILATLPKLPDLISTQNFTELSTLETKGKGKPSADVDFYNI